MNVIVRQWKVLGEEAPADIYYQDVMKVRFEFNGQQFEVREVHNRDALVLSGDDSLTLKPIASNCLSFEYQEVDND